MLLGAALLGACAADRAPRAAGTHEPPPEYPGYRLVWADEFNRDGAPSEENWVFETGFVRNQESQWYQPANARCERGLLVIEARRERVENPRYDERSKDWRRVRPAAEYTSASIKTMGRHSWRYGRFEVRARIDTRSGLWPACWTVGSGTAEAPARPWPACGEIDILESFRGMLLANAAWAGPRPGAVEWDAAKVPLSALAREAGLPGVAAWAERFHVWRMDWDESFIRIWVDGRLLNEVDLSRTMNGSPDGANPLREPHHLILNLAIGGTSGGDPSRTEFPGRFEVDWVRVYQRNSE